MIDEAAIATALSAHFEVRERGGAAGGGLTLVSKHSPELGAFGVDVVVLGDVPALMGMRGPLATQKKHALTSAYTSCLALSFNDLPAVLDEMNTLILAQEVLQGLTKQPMILAWNRTEVPPT